MSPEDTNIQDLEVMLRLTQDEIKRLDDELNFGVCVSNRDQYKIVKMAQDSICKREERIRECIEWHMRRFDEPIDYGISRTPVD